MVSSRVRIAPQSARRHWEVVHNWRKLVKSLKDEKEDFGTCCELWSATSLTALTLSWICLFSFIDILLNSFYCHRNQRSFWNLGLLLIVLLLPCKKAQHLHRVCIGYGVPRGLVRGILRCSFRCRYMCLSKVQFNAKQTTIRFNFAYLPRPVWSILAKNLCVVSVDRPRQMWHSRHSQASCRSRTVEYMKEMWSHHDYLQNTLASLSLKFSVLHTVPHTPLWRTWMFHLQRCLGMISW